MSTSYVPVSRARGLALGALTVAAAVGVGSFLLGLVPFVVEPAGMSEPVSCGSTWFRGSGLPAECYAQTDWWAVVAKTGLVVAALLLIVSAVAAVRSRGNRYGPHIAPVTRAERNDTTGDMLQTPPVVGGVWGGVTLVPEPHVLPAVRRRSPG